MCYVSWKLNLSGKIQILKYWLTASYSKCIIWGHSIITLPQNDQNLDTPSTLICTCLILIFYFDSHLFWSASVNTTKNISMKFLLVSEIQMVLISRHGLQISLEKWNLEKIGYPCFEDLIKIEAKVYYIIKKWNRKNYFSWMLHNLTRGWYLCCLKYW